MSKGLGDRIGEVLEKTGVKKIVETVADIMDADCGCEERRVRLNAIGKRLGIGESGAVEVMDQDEDPDSPPSRRARNQARKAAWEEEHGRPYGTSQPG